MKWTALYLAIVSGQPFGLNDVDGPIQFRWFCACHAHATKAARQMGVILRERLILAEGIEVRFKCVRKIDGPSQ